MADQDKQSSELQKLRHDLDFWKRGYEKSETEKNQIAAQLVQKSSEIVAANDRVAVMERTLKDLSEDRQTALRLLRILAQHVAGRDGMLQLSKTFCNICQNPNQCPLREVNDFIGNPVEVAA
jgi:chromosome segregation ATPase